MPLDDEPVVAFDAKYQNEHKEECTAEQYDRNHPRENPEFVLSTNDFIFFTVLQTDLRGVFSESKIAPLSNKFILIFRITTTRPDSYEKSGAVR